MQSFVGDLVEGVFFRGDGEFVWSVTSIKLRGGFVGVSLRRGCSPVNLVVFFQARFHVSSSGGLLLHTEYPLYIYISPGADLGLI